MDMYLKLQTYLVKQPLQEIFEVHAHIVWILNRILQEVCDTINHPCW